MDFVACAFELCRVQGREQSRRFVGRDCDYGVMVGRVDFSDFVHFEPALFDEKSCDVAFRDFFFLAGSDVERSQRRSQQLDLSFGWCRTLFDVDVMVERDIVLGGLARGKDDIDAS